MIWIILIFVLCIVFVVGIEFVKERDNEGMQGIGVALIIGSVVLLICIGQFANIGGSSRKSSSYSYSSSHKHSSSSSSGSSHSSSGSSYSSGHSGSSSYDAGYDSVYDNEDYDEHRYNTDSDYANGVDDAMDELDW